MRSGDTQSTVPSSVTADLLVPVFHLKFYIKSQWKTPFHINASFRNTFLGPEKFRGRKTKSFLPFTSHVKQKT